MCKKKHTVKMRLKHWKEMKGMYQVTKKRDQVNTIGMQKDCLLNFLKGFITTTFDINDNLNL